MTFVPYRPVVELGDELVEDESAPAPGHLDRVRRVLEFYGEPFRAGDDGTLLIPAALAADRDTLWNYTSKAEDPAWLSEHVAS